MSKITRRSVAALLASVAGVAAGFINAAHAEPAIDPIYEKINRVTEAEKTYDWLQAAHEKAERRYFAAVEKLPAPMHEGVTLRSPEDVDSYLNRLFMRPAIRAAFARRLSQDASPALRDLAAKFESPEKDQAEMREHDALRERLHAEVASYETAMEKVRASTSIDETNEAATDALEARDILSEAALGTMPTTLAGGAAFVQFARGEIEMARDEEAGLRALATLSAFFSRVA